MSCQEVSQPGGGIHLAKRSGCGGAFPPRDIRPRWHAGQAPLAGLVLEELCGQGGTGSVGLTGC